MPAMHSLGGAVQLFRKNVQTSGGAVETDRSAVEVDMQSQH